MLQFNPSILAKLQLLEKAERLATLPPASRAFSAIDVAEKSASVVAGKHIENGAFRSTLTQKVLTGVL